MVSIKYSIIIIIIIITCGDRDETIYCILSEFSYLAQKEGKTQHDCREGDPPGIVYKLKFDLSTKRYMHKPESVRKNETHKILYDFEI